MKVNKEEILSQFFQNMSGREGLDPEYQRKLQEHRPAYSCEFSTDTRINVWTNFGKDFDEEEKKRSKSWENKLVKQSLSKKEKK